jgi:hypothetical protein
MACHSLRNDLVVLDDENLGHGVIIESGYAATGRWKENGW